MISSAAIFSVGEDILVALIVLLSFTLITLLLAKLLVYEKGFYQESPLVLLPFLIVIVLLLHVAVLL